MTPPTQKIDTSNAYSDVIELSLISLPERRKFVSFINALMSWSMSQDIEEKFEKKKITNLSKIWFVYSSELFLH